MINRRDNPKYKVVDINSDPVVAKYYRIFCTIYISCIIIYAILYNIYIDQFQNKISYPILFYEKYYLDLKILLMATNEKSALEFNNFVHLALIITFFMSIAFSTLIFLLTLKFGGESESDHTSFDLFLLTFCFLFTFIPNYIFSARYKYPGSGVSMGVPVNAFGAVLTLLFLLLFFIVSLYISIYLAKLFKRWL